IADSTGAFAGGAFVCARPGGLLMGARDGAVDAGERQLRLSLCHHVGHDLVPHAAHRPAAKPQVGMVPIAQFSRDRPPFGTVVEPPDNRFNRAPILLAGPRATNLHRHNRRFELRPLGIRQDLHRLATPMPNKISRPVTSASHQLRTDPRYGLWRAHRTVRDCTMIDWDDVRHFLAVARGGSVRAAAERLGVNHSTVLRRIAQLEERLGVHMFEKLPSGYRLTAAGEEVLGFADQMEASSHLLETRVFGRDQSVRGLLRVTLAPTLATHLLMPDFADFARLHPEIEMEILSSGELANLTNR